MFRARKVYFRAVYDMSKSNIVVVGVILYPEILGYKLPENIKNSIKIVNNAKLIDYKYIQFVGGYTDRIKIDKIEVISKDFISSFDIMEFKRKFISKLENFINAENRKVIL